MNFLSIFDVIGPNMIGPSSSHTAGAVSISILARKMFPESIRKVSFILYGSFARTYRGHGTDRALLGGIFGYSTDNPRIRDAYDIVKKHGLEYEFVIDLVTSTPHPNTVDIVMTGISDYQLSVRGESVGGGKIKITRINQIDVEFTGEYSTLVIRQIDKSGVVAYITQCLSLYDVNIAFMRLFRENKGAAAYTIIESDERIPQSVLNEISKNGLVQEIMLIQV